MPEVDIVIGGRTFAVACQDGEEAYLLSAAQMLNAEASVLIEQIGRIPEPRMLLMAGLMLADKTAGLEEKLAASEARVSELEAQVRAAATAPAPEPERIEVPVLPAGVTETLAELAARAEAVAQDIEDRAQR
ncbi:Cell division protein ZapA [Roseivivax sp. THAF40]|uniref:cell division protein ZapA n=1 Tax=unclassified Roseivivax TaxID=2639302 RepID=UPI0012689A6F|nr:MULTISPECIES: cell division protein ZapA [unclassified Roseivivax]QFS83144.1 Cell division protein ZapA [Roseivivax sp. THAF197b]QFT46888.1 Cell division protein ZapA [Roseivivax sp. THAF40]